MFFSGLLYLGIGIIFLTQKNILLFAVKGLLDILAIFFGILTIFQIIGFIPIRKRPLTAMSRLFGSLTNLAIALMIYYRPEEVISLLPMIFGIYAFTSGIVRFLIYLQYKKNQVSRRFFIVIGAIIMAVLGIMMIIEPLAYLIPLSNLIGIFFIFYGSNFLIDGLVEGLPLEMKDSFKRRVRISLPVFMVALIPHKILMEINKAFETEELNQDNLISFKENIPCDLEVFIHVGEKGTYAFGHVDIWFDGKIMTYGCYDESTFKLGGAISDGVLVEIYDKEKYIAFSQSHLGKTLFGFGLKLNEEQKIRVREKIIEIHENLYEWKPKSKIDEEMGIKPEQPYKEYSSILYENLKGKFYKFVRGPFKTYFVLNTNCVLLADTIVGQAGIDLVKIQGLISPGTYFEYFNREFLRKNSFVVSRTIYYDLEGKGKEMESEFAYMEQKDI